MSIFVTRYFTATPSAFITVIKKITLKLLTVVLKKLYIGQFSELYLKPEPYPELGVPVVFLGLENTWAGLFRILFRIIQMFRLLSTYDRYKKNKNG